MRQDLLFALIQRVIAAFWWPHPLVHVLNRRISEAREGVCDNYVLHRTKPAEYARTLVEVARNIPFTQKPLPHLAGLFSPGDQLKHRVISLLDRRRSTMTKINRLALLIICGSFLLSACLFAAGPDSADTDIKSSAEKGTELAATDIYKDIPAPYGDMARKLELEGEELKIFATKAETVSKEWQDYEKNHKVRYHELVKLHGDAARSRDKDEFARTQKLHVELHKARLKKYSDNCKSVLSLLTTNQKTYLLAKYIQQTVDPSLTKFKLTDSQNKKVVNMIVQAARKGVPAGELAQGIWGGPGSPMYSQPGRKAAQEIVIKAEKDVVTNEQRVRSVIDRLRAEVDKNLVGMKLSKKQLEGITHIVKDQAESAVRASQGKNNAVDYSAIDNTQDETLKRIHRDVLKKEQVVDAIASVIRETLISEHKYVTLSADQKKRLDAAITAAAWKTYEKVPATDSYHSKRRYKWTYSADLKAAISKILTSGQKLVIEAQSLANCLLARKSRFFVLTDEQKVRMVAIAKEVIQANPAKGKDWKYKSNRFEKLLRKLQKQAEDEFDVNMDPPTGGFIR